MKITKRYALLAFSLFLPLYLFTPSVRADTLSSSISGTLGDGDSPIEITFGADQSRPAIQNEKMENDLLERLLVTSYYQYGPLLAKFIPQRGHSRSITRMGLFPLVGAGRVLSRVTLAERWPLLITIVVILSVLLYMELLIRMYRRPRTKPVHPENVSHFSSTLRPGTRKSSGNSENG